jgi:hypothetical protein
MSKQAFWNSGRDQNGEPERTTFNLLFPGTPSNPEVAQDMADKQEYMFHLNRLGGLAQITTLLSHMEATGFSSPVRAKNEDVLDRALSEAQDALEAMALLRCRSVNRHRDPADMPADEGDDNDQ